MTHDILHIVNLDTIGGVEELFSHLIQFPTRHRHHVYVTGGKVHPHFQDTLYLFAKSVNYEKYLFGLKIPKWLRLLRRDYVLGKKYSHIVLWNRFDSISHAAEIIYYEHGASWIHKKGKVSSHYFDSISKILANSHAAKRMLELKWGVKKPITIVQNPLRADLEFVAIPRQSCGTPFRLGCIGRLIPLKGIPLVIQAVKELHEKGYQVTLQIAGDGEERDALEKLARGLPITFLGAIQDVKSFYDSIDLLLVPSIREPLGLVAIEAQARAVPVIAANIDGLPEAVAGKLIQPTLDISRYPEFGGKLEKLPDLVYDPFLDQLTNPKLIDPMHLGNSIRLLIDQPDRYRELSMQALKFAKSRPTFAHFAEKLLTFFN